MTSVAFLSTGRSPSLLNGGVVRRCELSKESGFIIYSQKGIARELVIEISHA